MDKPEMRGLGMGRDDRVDESGEVEELLHFQKEKGFKIRVLSFVGEPDRPPSVEAMLRLEEDIDAELLESALTEIDFSPHPMPPPSPPPPPAQSLSASKRQGPPSPSPPLQPLQQDPMNARRNVRRTDCQPVKRPLPDIRQYFDDRQQKDNSAAALPSTPLDPSTSIGRLSTATVEKPEAFCYLQVCCSFRSPHASSSSPYIHLVLPLLRLLFISLILVPPLTLPSISLLAISPLPRI